MSKTVVGLFNTIAEAQKVKETLVADGFAASSIRVGGNDHYSDFDSPSGHTDNANDGESFGGRISHFFHSLTGGQDTTSHEEYTRSVQGGSAMLTATVDDEDADDVADTLNEYGAREVEGTGRSTGSMSSTGVNSIPKGGPFDTGTTGEAGAYGSGYGAIGSTAQVSRTAKISDSPATGREAIIGEDLGERVIPVIDETIEVGKRQVARGGVRIYSHVVERPVDESINLREERVYVDRKAVNRPANETDLTSGTESFELRELGEEAVIAKDRRVVEEVRVGKDASERTETIHDTLRRTEVEVEQLPVGAGSSAGGRKVNE